MKLPADLPALTGLRALAALWVASTHVQAFVGQQVWFIEHGYLGVDLFFVLSGFILAHVYGARFTTLRWAEYRRYMLLRLGRIWPAYIVVLAFVVIVLVAMSRNGPQFMPVIDGEFWHQALQHAAMVQSWGLGGEINAFNIPGWSVSSELIGYLLLPLLCWIFWRLPSIALVALLAPAAALVFVAGFDLQYDGLRGAIGVPGTLRMLGEFTAGIIVYRFMSRAPDLGLPWDRIGWLALAAVAASAGLAPVISKVDLVAVVGFVVLVPSLARANGSLRRFFAHRTMVWLGEISYGIFLVHFPVMMVMILAAEKIHLIDRTLTPMRIAMMPIAMLATVAVGAALFYLVEKPARQWVRRRLAAPS